MHNNEKNKKKGINMALSESEKRKNFVANGNRRLRNAVKSIRLLINIGNTNYYKWGEQEKKTIFSKLDAAVREVKNSFNSSKHQENNNDEVFFK